LKIASNFAEKALESAPFRLALRLFSSKTALEAFKLKTDFNLRQNALEARAISS